MRRLAHNAVVRPFAAAWSVLSLVVLLSCAATWPSMADEISAEQEKKRAVLRDAYMAAKAAEKEAFDRYQSALERIGERLQTGTETLVDLQRKRNDATAKL